MDETRAVDDTEHVVPVRDQQGTELASGVGDPVAVAQGLPTAGTTSDECVPVSEVPEAAVNASNVGGGIGEPGGDVVEPADTVPDTTSADAGTPTELQGDGAAGPSQGSADTTGPVLPLYTHDGDIDPAFADRYPRASVDTNDGRPLYTFVDDVPGGVASADGVAGWHVYTGATTPVI